MSLRKLCSRHLSGTLYRNWASCFHTTPRLNYQFHESDKKHGYQKEAMDFDVDPWDVVKNIKNLKHEFKLLAGEIKDKLLDDPYYVLPGSFQMVWRFDSPDVIKEWNVTSDKDNDEGESHCQFVIGQNKKAIFSGYLDTKVPATATQHRTGYCTVRSPRPRVSFRRDVCYDWTNYTHLLMRIRGDGRSYMLTLSCPGWFDLLWADTYNYPLYTRGGPYWQDVKIPFSKFFLVAKGSIQSSSQSAVSLLTIAHFGITCADKHSGPFHLELDYVGLYNDPSHMEEFAYEQYRVPKFLTP